MRTQPTRQAQLDLRSDQLKQLLNVRSVARPSAVVVRRGDPLGRQFAGRATFEKSEDLTEH